MRCFVKKKSSHIKLKHEIRDGQINQDSFGIQHYKQNMSWLMIANDLLGHFICLTRYFAIIIQQPVRAVRNFINLISLQISPRAHNNANL